MKMAVLSDKMTVRDFSYGMGVRWHLIRKVYAFFIETPNSKTSDWQRIVFSKTLFYESMKKFSRIFGFL